MPVPMRLGRGLGVGADWPHGDRGLREELLRAEFHPR